MIRLSAALCALFTSASAAAQAIVTSGAPERVSITIYRNPDRPAEQALNLRWLNGFALITEQRRIDVPAGEAEIRFEGVAGGILPESAIVTGLPDGLVEKNQGAYLLSPANLLDRSLGKRVQLRRTIMATGEVREHEAVVRSGAGGAVVLQTEAGFEAMRCTGLPETVNYDEVPEGLSAKPTLSVRARSSRAAAATVTLSYLASGFDWQANYVATLAPKEDRLDLFAWVTLANGDETGFVRAETQTVAGRLNREQGNPPLRPRREALHLQCWPDETTSDIPIEQDEGELIVVSGYFGSLHAAQERKRSADVTMDSITADNIGVLQEELGDLKLYRVPEPVTVASNSQKQVALLDRSAVKVESFYRLEVSPLLHSAQLIRPIRVLKLRNREQDGLGLPLPAGGVALFRAGYARPVLVGEGSTQDKAVGEDVEIEFSEPTGVTAEVVHTGGDTNEGAYRITVTNDRDRAIRFDAEFGENGQMAMVPLSGRAKLGRRNGRRVWSVIVPAKGSTVLTYRLKLKK